MAKKTRTPPAIMPGAARSGGAQPKAVARATVGGPAHGRRSSAADDPGVTKMEGAQALAAAFPHNVNKASEYDPAAALRPKSGPTAEPKSPGVTASTITEENSSAKTGQGSPSVGVSPLVGSLDRVRVDSGGQPLTTNQGVAIGDNQNSLKAGLRGPTLLEDFILREKITHFDHERIPERIVHARGSAAHGYFECEQALSKFTRASIFAEVGKRTPVFVRFSTVVGERGSTDTARDVRGFAVKFYTDEGNWDLVGNNIPIFFIQDAMKFPDLVHAAKPEPHFAMPQAATAHDTFWDFISLMPESTAMMMWAMSDRAIPRSFRMMQGFGVHTFRFVNANGESQFVKFHWNPVAGTHSLVWDEAVKISGADSDFHRRDLWEAIEAGAYPEWELGVQLFTEEQAEKFTFDVLDATKLIPEELVPVRRIGKMVLNRNPVTFSPRLNRSRSARRTSFPESASATILCLRGVSILTSIRKSRASGARIFTRFRSMPPWHPPTTISATGCIARQLIGVVSRTSRTRSVVDVRSRPGPPGASSRMRSHSKRGSIRYAAKRSGSQITTPRPAFFGTANRPWKSRTLSERFVSS
jgi:catalase